MNSDTFHFKKKYGQNFLKDDSIPNKIVEYAKIPSDTLVIEIGPGAGVLTKKLAFKAKQVVAYEIDHTLEEVLDQELIDFNNVQVIFADFLNRDIKTDLSSYSYSYLYVVANLPYYITTPIVTRLVESNLPIDKFMIMVQKEVAERFSAKPKSRDYGSITVFLNYYFDIKKEFLVSRNCFIPKPNVDSYVISLTRKKEFLPLIDSSFFFSFVRDSFQYKRKTLRNNLKGYDLVKVQEILEKYHLDLTVRAEELPLEIFVEISNHLVSN